MPSRKGPIAAASACELKLTRPRSSPLGKMEFYRILDSLPSRWRAYFITLLATGLREVELCDIKSESLDHEARAIWVKDSKSPTSVRTIYVAEEFWPWVLASLPVTVTPSHLRENWKAAVDRAEVKGGRLSDLARLRAKLLEEAKERPVIRLLGDEAQEDARLLAEALPVLALTEDEGRRLLLREVGG